MLLIFNKTKVSKNLMFRKNGSFLPLIHRWWYPLFLFIFLIFLRFTWKSFSPIYGYRQRFFMQKTLRVRFSLILYKKVSQAKSLWYFFDRTIWFYCRIIFKWIDNFVVMNWLRHELLQATWIELPFNAPRGAIHEP